MKTIRAASIMHPQSAGPVLAAPRWTCSTENGRPGINCTLLRRSGNLLLVALLVGIAIAGCGSNSFFSSEDSHACDSFQWMTGLHWTCQAVVDSGNCSCFVTLHSSGSGCQLDCGSCITQAGSFSAAVDHNSFEEFERGVSCYQVRPDGGTAHDGGVGCSTCSYCANVLSYSADSSGHFIQANEVECKMATCGSDGKPLCYVSSPMFYVTSASGCTKFTTPCAGQQVHQCSGSGQRCGHSVGSSTVCDDRQYCNEYDGRWYCPYGYDTSYCQ